METLSVRRLTSTRIPTVDGEFTLSLYENSQDDKDHLALLYGDIEDEDEVLVRVHSECFTGDVLGSLRCDCGDQLTASMRRIAKEGSGIILYLRQEGRGIGLLSKLRAYDLQDEGYDTVDANLLLGHGADERDYSIAAQILHDLKVSAVRLLTNNPEKIESLEEHDIAVSERVPLEPRMTRHNADYLRTKVNRMHHLLELGPMNGETGAGAHPQAGEAVSGTGRPLVTLTYAQSLDGSIASPSGEPLRISGEESLEMTHRLRASHDAILVGIETVLSDDPRLNVRRGNGGHPQPIVLDSTLRFPENARLLSCEGPSPLIVTSPNASEERQDRLEQLGATILRTKCNNGRGVHLESLMALLHEREIRSLMVEGGKNVLSSFFRQRLVDRVIVTVAPMFVGGVSALSQISSGDENDNNAPFPRLKNVQYHWLGEDLILEGEPAWNTSS